MKDEFYEKLRITVRRTVDPRLDNSEGRRILVDYWKSIATHWLADAMDLDGRLKKLIGDPRVNVAGAARAFAYAAPPEACKACGERARLYDRVDLAVWLAAGVCPECEPTSAAKRLEVRRHIERTHQQQEDTRN